MTKEEKIVEIRARVSKLEDKLAKVKTELGEACGEGCDWHDNNAYDLARSLSETYESLLFEAKKELKTLEKS